MANIPCADCERSFGPGAVCTCDDEGRIGLRCIPNDPNYYVHVEISEWRKLCALIREVKEAFECISYSREENR